MMYCKYCGSVLPMGSRFCPNCSNEVEDGYLKQAMNKNEVANFVGKNEAYFSREFANIVAGQKGRFNWVALWLGPFYCVYRKQHDILWRFYKVPLFGFFISLLGATIQILDGNMDAVALTKNLMVWFGLGFVADIWFHVAQVRLGRNFNRLYLENFKKIIAENKSLKGYGRTSVKNVVLFSLLSSLILSLPVVAIVKTEVFPALYSANSYGSVEEVAEKADENEVIYGYNSLNLGVEVDEAIQNAIIGSYDLGDGITVSIDDNLNMTMYAHGQQQSWLQLSLWDVQGNTVIFQGYLGDEVWEALDINSMEEAEVQMKFITAVGTVTKIFENGTELWFKKI